MGKIKVGKSMHTLTTTKYNSSNMTNTKIINAVKNGSIMAYEILNLKYNIKKLNRIIEQKIATITQLNEKIGLYCKMFGAPHISDNINIKLSIKSHRAQFVIEQNLFMAWCLWLNDEEKLTMEMIKKTSQYLEGFTQQQAKAILVQQINDWMLKD